MKRVFYVCSFLLFGLSVYLLLPERAGVQVEIWNQLESQKGSSNAERIPENPVAFGRNDVSQVLQAGYYFEVKSTIGAEISPAELEPIFSELIWTGSDFKQGKQLDLQRQGRVYSCLRDDLYAIKVELEGHLSETVFFSELGKTTLADPAVVQLDRLLHFSLILRQLDGSPCAQVQCSVTCLESSAVENRITDEHGRADFSQLPIQPGRIYRFLFSSVHLGSWMVIVPAEKLIAECDELIFSVPAMGGLTLLLENFTETASGKMTLFQADANGVRHELTTFPIRMAQERHAPVVLASPLWAEVNIDAVTSIHPVPTAVNGERRMCVNVGSASVLFDKSLADAKPSKIPTFSQASGTVKLQIQKQEELESDLRPRLSNRFFRRGRRGECWPVSSWEKVDIGLLPTTSKNLAFEGGFHSRWIVGEEPIWVAFRVSQSNSLPFESDLIQCNRNCVVDLGLIQFPDEGVLLLNVTSVESGFRCEFVPLDSSFALPPYLKLKPNYQKAVSYQQPFASVIGGVPLTKTWIGLFQNRNIVAIESFWPSPSRNNAEEQFFDLAKLVKVHYAVQDVPDPTTGIRFHCYNNDSPFSFDREVLTTVDKTGQIMLPAGKYQVSTLGPYAKEMTGTIRTFHFEFLEGTTHFLDMNDIPGEILSGSVAVNNQQIRPFSAILVTDGGYYRAPISANGEFRFFGLPAEDFSLTIRGSSGVTLSEGVTVSLEKGTYLGELTQGVWQVAPDAKQD
ncbi:MAG: hypothetical protein HN405_09765 [Planctomycetes bacterium]|jgi:hypothetical protein|nr:hypothetical protein [Planctomycetota bacterium]MBT4028658.1 hypothetical protein [Planctomycetota bacterium]MBT4559551.1 hypothetical protein [Planctomycetota bacterium]MBT5100794.1 hypothetical protein [Planctomycetota bacterium]MBT7318923.1 hypothetical protein [Planctomycetota bacterium]